MNEKRVRILLTIPVVVLGILAAAACLALMLSGDSATELAERVPGMDGRWQKEARLARLSGETVRIGENFQKFDGVPSDLPGSWPCFRGPNRDNISPEAERLADKWPQEGPPLLWSVDLGDGHAGAAVGNGRVYVLDYDERRKADALRCFSLADGGEIWRRWYRVKVKRNHGMSRTIPAVTDRFVVTIGPRCHVMCVDAVSGDFHWGIDLAADYGTKVPLWYTGQCPLLDGSCAVIAVGGTNTLMMGVDCESGKTVWETPNPDRWDMSHSSVMPMTLNGRKMYVYCSIGGIAGVAADGPDRGRLLWRSTEWKGSVLSPAPVVLPDGRIYATAGYNSGSVMLKVTGQGDSYSVSVLKRLTTDKGLASEQQTPILYRNRLFGVLPKDAGALKQQFACVDPDDHGTYLWTSGKTSRFGLGPYILADGKFYILNDDGMLTMASANATNYVELAAARVLKGVDCWAPIALSGGRMILRDSKRMVCIDVSDRINR